MALKWLLSLALIVTASQAADDNVKVGFYSEALCPGCDALAEGEMNKAVKEVGEIFDLEFVPWGNAKYVQKGVKKVIECQHGPIECVMNIVENCVIHYYPQREKFWPYVLCTEAHGYDQTLGIAKKCAEQSGLDWDQLNTCQGGKLGKELALQAMNVTDQLNPPHTYTPWVTINGKHFEDTQRLIPAICEAYKGSKHVEPCKEALKRLHDQKQPEREIELCKANWRE